MLQALLVTFLWSTSWVLIKIGLHNLPAITFAGLRYGLAFLCLAPFALRALSGPRPTKLTRRQWLHLVALGVVMYALTQGAQFLALSLLPAITVSLLLRFSTPTVAFLGIALLGERLTARQWAGLGLLLVGVALYFLPADLSGSSWAGIAVAAVGVLSNAGAAIMGRGVNRYLAASPIIVTTVSMGVGAALLLALGISTQGIPSLSFESWLIVAWLAVVNTAFAFTLWNHTLRSLTAVQSSTINSTMFVQIAVLAWLFLGERPGPLQLLGLVVTGIGVLAVQAKGR